MADTETREAPAVDLTPITDRMDQIEARMVAPAPVPPRVLQVREAFALQLADAVQTGKARALADVLSSGNAGILPPQWSSEVRNAFDSTRYLIPRLGSVAFPSAGYTLTVPKVLQNTTVAARGTEKTEVPSRAFTTGTDTFTAKWFAGAVDIAMELVMQSDPAIQGLIVQNLFEQYGAATDADATTSLNGAGTATGAVLDFSSYKNFVGQIFTTSEAIRSATGEPGNLLQLKPASWASLIGMVDADGRRILATGGATNSDGSANLVAQSVDVGGILCFLNPRTTTDVQFNAKSARIAEKPPLQLTMGRDIGVLGATIWLPFFTTGIKRHAVTTAADRAAAKAAAEAEAE